MRPPSASAPGSTASSLGLLVGFNGALLLALHASVAAGSVRAVGVAVAGERTASVIAFVGFCALVDLGTAPLAFALAWPFSRVLRASLFWPLAVLACALVTTCAYVDARAFVAQGVHVYDPVAVRALANPDVNRELHVGAGTFVEVAGVFALAAALAGGVAWLLARARPRRAIVAGVFRVWLIALLVAAGLVAGERARLFAAGSPLTPSLPLLGLLRPHPPARDWRIAYPGEPLAPTTMTKKPNITVIAVESLRASAFGDELMPNLRRFAKERGCIVPGRHFSSSHATELGVFSLLYGLDASRYPAFSQAGTRSALLQILRDQGYVVRGASASPLRAWNHAGFITAQLDGWYEPGDGESWRRDAELSRWARSLPHATPAFTFLFLDATHLDYSYPPELEIDRPVERGDFTRALARDGLQGRKQEVINRYRNAVRFVDRTLGELLPTLAVDEVVVVTGDHGEELWDDGLLGHSAPRLIDARIQVPLVLCLPSEPPRAVALSSHADVLPTVLAWAGVHAPADGESLLDARRDDVVVTGAGFPVDDDHLCLIRAHDKLWLEMDPAWPDRFRLQRATDLDDHPLEPPARIDEPVAAFVRRFQRFLRP